MKYRLLIVFLFIAQANLTSETIFSQFSTIQQISKPVNDFTIYSDAVNSDSIASYIQTLQSFGTRFVLTDNRYTVSDWLFKKFKEFGYEEVQFDTFETAISHQTSWFNYNSSITQRNVLCVLPGSTVPEELYILCAHYDAYNQADNPMKSAPGADDNGSGIAALLEIARVLVSENYRPARTIVFAALSGEELMASNGSGSKYYAARLKNENAKVRLVINHDMIGYTNTTVSSSTVNINRYKTDSYFAQIACNAASQYTKINAQHTDYYGADLKPFFISGFHGIYFEETQFSPYYHSTNDVLANINTDYCCEVIRTSLTTALWTNSMPNEITNIHYEVMNSENGTLCFSWSPSVDFDLDRYRFYYSVNGGISFNDYYVRDTSFVVADLETFDNVFYAVSAISIDNIEGYAAVYSTDFSAIDLESTVSPSNCIISRHFPNPFNSSISIEYSVPWNGQVKMTLINLLGEQVAILSDSWLRRGSYSQIFNLDHLKSGMYFCELSIQSPDGNISRDAQKIICLK